MKFSLLLLFLPSLCFLGFVPVGLFYFRRPLVFAAGLCRTVVFAGRVELTLSLILQREREAQDE